MSHELRTPLNAIIGFSEMIQAGTFGPLGSDRYEEYINDIHTSGNFLLNVINDILDMSKIEAGHFSLDREQIDLCPLINETVRMISLQADEKNITVETRIEDAMQLYADRRAVKQVLINLPSNAVKFTSHNGHITVRARKTGSALFMTIQDTGVGIPKSALKRSASRLNRSKTSSPKPIAGRASVSPSPARWRNCMAAGCAFARPKASARWLRSAYPTASRCRSAGTAPQFTQRKFRR